MLEIFTTGHLQHVEAAHFLSASPAAEQDCERYTSEWKNRVSVVQVIL